MVSREEEIQPVHSSSTEPLQGANLRSCSIRKIERNPPAKEKVGDALSAVLAAHLAMAGVLRVRGIR